MFEVQYLKRELRGHGPLVGLIALLLSVSIILMVLSVYWQNQKAVVMGNFQDCSWVHTVPGPSNCAGNNRMAEIDNLNAKSQISWVASLVIVGGLLTVPLIIRLRAR
jgi:hypothetical protein